MGQKRFGLEGAESAIVILDAILNEAVIEGLHESVMGMSHRGRLNVLANIVGKSYGEIFEEFEGNLDPESVQGSGDVKYHKGASGTFAGAPGGTIPVTMASNPSHLEAVDPVVVGMARARQDALGGERGSGPASWTAPGDPFPVLPILLHGDAAFAGQGVVAETLNLSGLAGYRTGGTVHVVINNQLGFTTAPEAARSSVYPTDVAKMVQAPIFHVNGDDPEACVRAARLAFGFRQAFHKDVVIDMVCYRRHGHNEGDDPSYTQPLMYALIDAKRSVRKLYTEALVRRGDISLEEAEQALDDFSARLQAALDETRAEAEGAPAAPLTLPEYIQPDLTIPRVETGIDPETVAPPGHRGAVGARGLRPPPEAGPPVRAARQGGGRRRDRLGAGRGAGLRLAPPRGDRRPGDRPGHPAGDLLPPARRPGRPRDRAPSTCRSQGLGGGRFTIRDSLLSEYACVGFEYGYSVEAPDDLVAWEAQFGDFWNGAEIIVDNFLVAAEDKWGQKSGLVLLLPHGYEGQGPEHSSARIERFLTLCARGNLRVAEPTTAAQYFHLLRAQVRIPDRKPLIVFTPKSLLRARQARSPVAAFTSGSFAEVLDDPAAGADGLRPLRRVDRVVLCTGKVAFDALARRDELGDAGAHVAVVRVEQLYPWPKDTLAEVLRGLPAGRGGRLAAGGAREHGGVELRPQPPPPAAPPYATSCATSAGPSRPAPPRAAPPCTGSSRRTCWSAPSAEPAAARGRALQPRKSWARRHPHLGREAERLDVDPLVDAVEHGPVLLEPDGRAVQPEPVGHGAERPGVAGVGGPDGQEGHGRRTRVEDAGSPAGWRPTAGCRWARSRPAPRTGRRSPRSRPGRRARRRAWPAPRRSPIPGRARMSTVELDPVGDHVDLRCRPRMMVGAMVVWVQAWAWRARPEQGQLVAEGVDAVGVEERLATARGGSRARR